MRKAHILLLVIVFVAFWPFDAIGTAVERIQAAPIRSLKPQVSCGENFSAAVKEDGTLWTWGYDQCTAQHGISTFRPKQVGTDNNWSMVSVGGDLVGAQVAAIKTDGRLFTWAWPLFWDDMERLRRFSNRSISKVPVQVGKDSDWVAVSVGGDHIAALKVNGTLWTWGNNQHGQLGDGTNVSRSAPVQVGKDRDWVAVSAGAYHTAALKKDGTLWMWGWNQFGQLGIGTGGDIRAPRNYADERMPVKVGEDRDWASVYAGLEQTAAIKKDGTLWVWGMHEIVAPGVDRIQVRPLRVNRDDDWASISLGKNHAAALKTDGTLWTWGNNQHGQLGDGTNVSRSAPVQVGKDRDWLAVSVGTHHTAASKTGGALWTWGDNQHGQLGDGTLTSSDRARYFPFRNAPAAVSLAPDNGAEARLGTPKVIRLYPRVRTNGVSAAYTAALRGESSVPFIENGRTMVPLRFLSESLGAVVRFDSAKKEVTIAEGTVTVQLRLGDKAARISQEGAVLRTVALDVPARAMHGRTVVPLRFVSEALGATVIRTEDGGIFVLR